MTAIKTTSLTKRYGDVTALDDVTISLAENRIYGLLGRNGAGKTTLMQLLTGQVFATSGTMEVLGENPVENVAVLSQTCFIQESQKYPSGYRPIDVLKIAAGIYPNWDQEYADRIIEAFSLPTKRVISKISRGQFSAIGIVLGLASRAPVTFFDEPYLGLDAVARNLFYDLLLADFAERPRTVVLSTHHIDEAANLLEHVVILDKGKVLLDAEADELQSAATTVSGRADAVDAFAASREVIDRTTLGAFASATVRGSVRAEAEAAGLETSPVSLQTLFVQLTTAPGTDRASDLAHH